MSTGSIPPNVGLAICALVGPHLPDLSASEVIRRLTAPAAGGPALPKGYSFSETARILRVSRRKVYDLTRRGVLPVVRLGHRTCRIPHAALEALLDGRAAATAPEARPCTP